MIHKNQLDKLKRICFKDKRIQLSHEPRTGICSLCRKQGLTHIHHINYHDSNPLKDTIELCVSCHNMQRKKYLDRICLNCGSNKTYLRKENWYSWYKYKDGWICKNCYKKLRKFVRTPR